MAASALTTLDQVSGKAFDYLIIGGGTAGLTLAARLSEDPSKSVLVLEAGGAHLNDPMIDMPASYGKFFTNKEYDYAFMTIPQKHAENTSFFWPRGKGLGGSSGANFYLWNRPAVEDVNAWERLGNPGWNWENFLKYSIKCEKFIPADENATKAERLTYDPKVHGTDGPIALGFPNLRPGWDVALQDTLEALGLPRLVEPQGGDRVGTGMDLATVDPRTNKRTTSVAYLEQAGARPNLKVLVNAPVARILSAPGSGFVASGVEFLYDGQKHTVSTTADGEVILSAGTIKSPQVLELSGIGDPKVLSGLGIETKVDLPAVGTNAQDHLFAGVAYELKEPEKYNTIDPLLDPKVAEEQVKLYAEGKGLLTIGIVGISMAPLKMISDRAEEIEANPPTGGDAPGIAEQRKEQIARLREGAANAEFVTIPGFYSFPNPPAPGAKHVSLCTTLNRPFSRGTIHAGSTDPLEPPVIDPHYFEEDIDRLTYIEQVKFCRKVAQTEPFKSVLGREVNPGPDVKTDEDISLWLKKYLTTVHHTASTCSMLPRDKGGVVDPELKVYGTQKLRVVDLSVVPLIPSAHTQSIVYAIAEQAADIIKGTSKA
ncbi:GMC oxidoreductase [Lentinus tigrinus ALCF2SS1-7]|uniref:GMC oxidoreductase n=1 Tax=Lentinus tigrinus ALCF2SS1-6 TaxID=1328759 RepID=A0A5C2RYY4_9APHY|nr:GMC oxidoreductase [Lentinus tigrinus ALCF2SS1-6]RPD71044.1 GMC oxidoreductase [Lentinus tigrinus ALCF2SS1-7]